MISVNNIFAGYKDKMIIKDISISFLKGEFCAILGPNGSGKTTFLKSLLGGLPGISGNIVIEDKDISVWRKKDLAKKIAYVPQEFKLQFDYLVEDLILMGRYPHIKMWQNYSNTDREKIKPIVDLLELSDKMNNNYSVLSGGEQKRVSIARALAQDADILLIDEGFANLDINHQIEIMQLLSKINKEVGTLIILVSHNINLATEYCSRVILFNEGSIVASGKPEDVLTKENLFSLYGMELQIINNPLSNKPNVIYPPKK